MRKIYVKAKINLILNADEDANFEEVISALDVFSQDDRADVDSFEINNAEITDSK